MTHQEGEVRLSVNAKIENKYVSIPYEAKNIFENHEARFPTDEVGRFYTEESPWGLEDLIKKGNFHVDEEYPTFVGVLKEFVDFILCFSSRFPLGFLRSEFEGMLNFRKQQIKLEERINSVLLNKIELEFQRRDLNYEIRDLRERLAKSMKIGYIDEFEVKIPEDWDTE